MNHLFELKSAKYLLASISLSCLLACGGGGGGNDTQSSTQSFTSGGGTLSREAIDNFVNGFVLPKLELLDLTTKNLSSSIEKLNSEKSEVALEAAKANWIASRAPWEQTEAAPFGPFDIYGIDPSVDTWPLNATDLKNVLDSGENLNENFVDSLDNTLKGFHAIEYILFGQSGNKTAAEITPREYEFLSGLTKNLRSRVVIFKSAWIEGYAGQDAYAKQVVLAGQGSTVFAREQDVLEQVAQGLIASCDEVAEAKIAEPFNSRDPNLVESQFSQNSIADFSSNIEGAFESYQISLSDLISSKDAAVDTQVKQLFNNAIAALKALPTPFPAAIQDPKNDAAIKNVQNLLRSTRDFIDSSVLPITRS